MGDNLLDGLCLAAQRSGSVVVWNPATLGFVKASREHMTPKPGPDPFTEADRVKRMQINSDLDRGKKRAK